MISCWTCSRGIANRATKGNATANLFIGNILLGNVTVYNFNLKLGDSTFEAMGTLDVAAAMSNIGSIMDSELPDIEEGEAIVTLRGVHVVSNGVELVGWPGVSSG